MLLPRGTIDLSSTRYHPLVRREILGGKFLDVDLVAFARYAHVRLKSNKMTSYE